MIALWIVPLLITSCAGQLLNDTSTSPAIIDHARESTSALSSLEPIPTAQWNQLKRYSMHYGGIPTTTASEVTALSNVSLKSESLSSRATSVVVGGIKLIILAFRVIGEFFRKFGAEIRVAKCLFMYGLTFQPLSSKVASGTIVDWLTGSVFLGRMCKNEVFEGGVWKMEEIAAATRGSAELVQQALGVLNATCACSNEL